MKRLILAGLAVLLVGSTATAATITAGNAGVYAPNTAGFVHLITVSPGPNPPTGETAQSMNFYLSIGAPQGGTPGTAVKPDIASITFVNTGYLFDGGFETPWPDVNPIGIDAFGGAFIIPAAAIGTGQNLARVVFNTNDVGVWALNLHSLDGTNLTQIDAAPLDTLNHGTITVGAIPEPAMVVQLLGLFGSGGFGLLLRWRRKCAP